MYDFINAKYSLIIIGVFTSNLLFLNINNIFFFVSVYLFMTISLKPLLSLCLPPLTLFMLFLLFLMELKLSIIGLIHPLFPELSK